MNFLTIKITDKHLLLALWDRMRLIKFKKLNKEFANKLNLYCRLIKIPARNVIYFDQTNQYNLNFFKIKLDRVPFKRENYKNLKHQLYFYLIKAINDNTILIECDFPKDEFIQELNNLKQNESDNNKLEIISRKQIIENLGHDVHIVDLLSYRFFYLLKGIL